MKKRLDELCDFINGGAWSDKEYVNAGMPVLKVSNLQRESISFENIDFIPETSRTKYSKHILIKNDLVIATVGSHPSLINSAAGRASIIPKSAEGYLLNQNAVCLRTKDVKILDQKFLAYLGKTEVFQHFIQQRGKGAANQMRIAIGSIKEYEVELPKIEHQVKIGSILSAFDDLIENNRKRIMLLEEVCQLTFQDWYSKGKWNECCLGDLVGYEIGGGWGEEKSNEVFKTGAFVIRGTDMDKITVGDIGNVPYRYHKASNLSSRRLQEGDIIFEVSGGSSYEGVAKTLLINDSLLRQFDDNVMCASFCKLLRPQKPQYSNFLFLFLRFLREIKATEVFEVRSASSIVNFNWTAFLKFQKIKLPDSNSLENISNLINAIYNQVYVLGNHSRLLKEAREILLPRLMSGIIDVSEFLEDVELAAEAKPIY